MGFVGTGRTDTSETEKEQTWNPLCHMDGHLSGVHKVKTAFLVNRRLSLPVVNKHNCFVVHPQVHFFSVLFTYFLCS